MGLTMPFLNYKLKLRVFFCRQYCCYGNLLCHEIDIEQNVHQ